MDQATHSDQEAELHLHIILVEEQIHQPTLFIPQDHILADLLQLQLQLCPEDPAEQILLMTNQECRTIMKLRNISGKLPCVFETSRLRHHPAPESPVVLVPQDPVEQRLLHLLAMTFLIWKIF